MSQLAANTLGPTYNMFGYKAHPLTRSSFFCIFLVFDCTEVVPPFTSLADSYKKVPLPVTEVKGVGTCEQSKTALVVPTDNDITLLNNEMSYSSSICRCSVSAEKVGVRTFMPGPDLSSVWYSLAEQTWNPFQLETFRGNLSFLIVGGYF